MDAGINGNGTLATIRNNRIISNRGSGLSPTSNVDSDYDDNYGGGALWYCNGIN